MDIQNSAAQNAAPYIATAQERIDADLAREAIKKHLTAQLAQDDPFRETIVELANCSTDNAVSHPSHCTQYKGLEIIQLTEQMNFNRGNAVKYIARAGFKNPATEVEDLKKAVWYIQREIERISESTMVPPPAAVAITVAPVEVMKQSYLRIRCPECADPLTEKGVCPNGHGVMYIGDSDVKHWKPDAIIMQSDPHHCPECGTRLVGGSCPKRHGWIRVVNGDNTWISQNGDKSKNQPPDCPECHEAMNQDGVFEGLFYCKQGHGRVKFDDVA